jgi:hypothetical protein
VLFCCDVLTLGYVQFLAAGNRIHFFMSRVARVFHGSSRLFSVLVRRTCSVPVSVRRCLGFCVQLMRDSHMQCCAVVPSPLSYPDFSDSHCQSTVLLFLSRYLVYVAGTPAHDVYLHLCLSLGGNARLCVECCVIC